MTISSFIGFLTIVCVVAVAGQQAISTQQHPLLFGGDLPTCGADGVFINPEVTCLSFPNVQSDFPSCTNKKFHTYFDDATQDNVHEIETGDPCNPDENNPICPVQHGLVTWEECTSTIPAF